MTSVLLIAIDDSEQSLQAVDYGVKLAKLSGSSIELFHVQPKINTHYANKKIGKKQLQEYKKECAMSILEKGRKRIDDEINVSINWRQGLVDEEICKRAIELGALSIIIGTKNLKNRKGRFLGSNCYRVIRGSSCPVIVV